MKRFIFASALLVMFFLGSAAAYAATPTLALSPTSGGDLVQVRVTADPNTPVALYYTDVGGNTQNISLGTTDTEGYLSAMVSGSTYELTHANRVYVVARENGSPQSSSLLWPVPNASTTYFSLQTNTITVGVNQTTVVPVNGLGSATLAIAANSNSSVASFSISGTQIQVTGTQAGTTVASVCVAGTTTNCQTLSVTVTTSSTSAFYFNPSSLALLTGQTKVAVINGSISGTLFVSSNSNPSVVQANLVSNALTLIGNSTNGNSTIRVCSTSGGCTSLEVSVVSSSGANGTKFALGKSAVSLTTGAVEHVLIAGDGHYTISGNLNPSIVSSVLEGNSTLTLTAIAPGTRSIYVCDDLNNCASVQVTVTAPVLTVAPTTTPVAVATTTTRYLFTKYLTTGSSGTEVLALQLTLKLLHFFTATPNGNFGPATKAAVVAFQKAHKLTPLGVVGPATRALLNAKI